METLVAPSSSHSASSTGSLPSAIEPPAPAPLRESVTIDVTASVEAGDEDDQDPPSPNEFGSNPTTPCGRKNHTGGWDTTSPWEGVGTPDHPDSTLCDHCDFQDGCGVKEWTCGCRVDSRERVSALSLTIVAIFFILFFLITEPWNLADFLHHHLRGSLVPPIVMIYLGVAYIIYLVRDRRREDAGVPKLGYFTLRSQRFIVLLLCATFPVLISFVILASHQWWIFFSFPHADSLYWALCFAVATVISVHLLYMGLEVVNEYSPCYVSAIIDAVACTGADQSLLAYYHGKAEGTVRDPKRIRDLKLVFDNRFMRDHKDASDSTREAMYHRVVRADHILINHEIKHLNSFGLVARLLRLVSGWASSGVTPDGVSLPTR